MEEKVSIVWEDPTCLEDTYKGWTEDFVRNYIHRGIRPKYKDFDRISKLLDELGTIDRDEYPKYYNMNKLALEYMIGQFEHWINKGENIPTKKLLTSTSFKAQDLLPKFDSYAIINRYADPSFKMMDLSGIYWNDKYLIGTLLFKKNEEGPGLEFTSEICGVGPKTCNLEGFYGKQIGIGSHLAYNSDNLGKPEIYFLVGTGGQILDPKKKEIIV